LWRIKFGGPGDPAIMMDIGGAAKLAVELRPIDEDWAKKLEAAVSTARRYAGLPPSTVGHSGWPIDQDRAAGLWSSTVRAPTGGPVPLFRSAGLAHHSSDPLLDRLSPAPLTLGARIAFIALTRGRLRRSFLPCRRAAEAERAVRTTSKSTSWRKRRASA